VVEGVFSKPSSVDSDLLALPRFAGVTTARCQGAYGILPDCTDTRTG